MWTTSNFDLVYRLGLVQHHGILAHNPFLQLNVSPEHNQVCAGLGLSSNLIHPHLTAPCAAERDQSVHVVCPCGNLTTEILSVILKSL